MFKDYYSILEVDFNSSNEKIKSAYYYQSKKWHPDVNCDKDTTEMMQNINEAYAILKDFEKKKRYDAEYLIFKSEFRTYKQDNYNYTYEYTVKDEKVSEDIFDARTFAEKLVKDFLSSLRETSKSATKGWWESAKPILLWTVALNLIIFIILLFLKS